MKTRKLALSVAAIFLAVLATTTWLAAQQEEKPQRSRYSRYIVTDLGALKDGPYSLAVGLNNKDWINGASGVADGSEHAVLWQKGRIMDMGTPGLGGPNSEAFGFNERGQASGLAETPTPDPNGEDFCGYGTHLICLAFLWQDGAMTPLPTLGGNNGEAGEINNRGEVAGQIGEYDEGLDLPSLRPPSPPREACHLGEWRGQGARYVSRRSGRLGLRDQ